MKKTPHGSCDAKCDCIVGVVKWHDNQCVTVATNYDSLDPTRKVKRWSSAKKMTVEVQQPTVVNSYNYHMGSVDLLDAFMANFRPMFRSKKWWWPLFINGINMLVAAAWRLHVEVGGKFDQLAFRGFIVRSLMQTKKSTSLQTGPSHRPLEERREGLDHHFAQNQHAGSCCMANTC